VLDPVRASLGPAVTRLVVVPDGPLHRVPFDALRLGDGRYTVEHFAVGTAPSATVTAELWRRPRTASADARPLRLLAFGDPTFARSGERRDGEAAIHRAAFDSGGTLPRLAESGREARLVAAYAPEAVVRLREEASEAYLKRVPLRDFRVIHFATHALVDDGTIAGTALALAPGGGESGFVAPGDLAALRLGADLVVLSACHTAGGVLVTGEGVRGLTAPLLQAGARAVVATGWRVDDRRTVTFVEQLYAALADGQPVVEALRAAKLGALRRGVPPGEWAAFTVVGDAFVTVPLRAPEPRIRWWVAAALAIVAPGGVAVAMRCGLRRRLWPASPDCP
jgi:CHAT domain-containing protein